MQWSSNKRYKPQEEYIEKTTKFNVSYKTDDNNNTKHQHSKPNQTDNTKENVTKKGMPKRDKTIEDQQHNTTEKSNAS